MISPWTEHTEQSGCCMDLVPISKAEWHAMRCMDSLVLGWGLGMFSRVKQEDYDTRYPWSVIHGDCLKMKYIFDVLGPYFVQQWNTRHRCTQP